MTGTWWSSNTVVVCMFSECAGHFVNPCDIRKVAKAVRGNLSDNHCNWSDAWLPMLLLDLYQYISKHPAPFPIWKQ